MRELGGAGQCQLRVADDALLDRPGADVPVDRTKNGADIRLAIDVIDDLSAHRHITYVLVVAGDSDYVSPAPPWTREPRAEPARELDKTHPGAAASLLEGLAETLTVLRLDVPPTLARTLRSTNAIESMIGICRETPRTSNAGAMLDGAALVRGRHARSRQVVVRPRLRLPAPTSTPRRARTTRRRTDCQCRASR